MEVSLQFLDQGDVGRGGEGGGGGGVEEYWILSIFLNWKFKPRYVTQYFIHINLETWSQLGETKFLFLFFLGWWDIQSNLI